MMESQNECLFVIDKSITNKLKLKKKKLYDEYVLTNKHIICKFKYLIICFDSSDDPTLSGGLINLTKERIKELFVEQNIELNSNKEKCYLFQILQQLHDWHPQISKLEVDDKNIYELDNIIDYRKSWSQIKTHLMQLPNNNCIKSDLD